MNSKIFKHSWMSAIALAAFAPVASASLVAPDGYTFPEDGTTKSVTINYDLNSDGTIYEGEPRPLNESISIGITRKRTVTFDFDFGGFQVNNPLLVDTQGNTDLSDDVFTQAATDDPGLLSLASAGQQGLLDTVGYSFDEGTFAASGNFVAVLTKIGDPLFGQDVSFAGSENEFTWSVGSLSVGDYNLDIFSLLDVQGSGTVQISAVPIPAAAILFGTALAGFAGFSARRKA